MLTIEQIWQSYDRDVLPKTAGEVQRIETKRAFYAASFALLTAIKTAADTLHERQAEMYLEYLMGEAEAFRNAVNEGRA